MNMHISKRTFLKSTASLLGVGALEQTGEKFDSQVSDLRLELRRRNGETIFTPKMTIAEALQIPDVNDSADRLVELALRGGGPDNVTVVVADVVDFDYEQTQPIVAGAVSGDDDRLVLPPDTAAGRASAINQRQSNAKRIVPQPEPTIRRPASRRRMMMAAVLILLAVLAGLGIGRAVVRNNYYVTAHEGVVSIMRGVQGSILGVAMAEPYLLGCLNGRNELSQISYGQSVDNLHCDLMQLSDLRPSERAQVEAGLPDGSLDKAIEQMRQLARTSLLPPCPPAAPPTPTPAPKPAPKPGPPGSAVPAAPPAPGAKPVPVPRAPATSTPAPPPRAPVTTLPAPPPKPGTDCRVTA